jgi:hypothetical protein
MADRPVNELECGQRLNEQLRSQLFEEIHGRGDLVAQRLRNVRQAGSRFLGELLPVCDDTCFGVQAKIDGGDFKDRMAFASKRTILFTSLAAKNLPLTSPFSLGRLGRILSYFRRNPLRLLSGMTKAATTLIELA